MDPGTSQDIWQHDSAQDPVAWYLDNVNMSWDPSLAMIRDGTQDITGDMIEPSWGKSRYSKYPQDPAADTDSPGYCEYGLRLQLGSTICPGMSWDPSLNIVTLRSEPIFTVSKRDCIQIQCPTDTGNMCSEMSRDGSQDTWQIQAEVWTQIHSNQASPYPETRSCSYCEYGFWGSSMISEELVKDFDWFLNDVSKI